MLPSIGSIPKEGLPTVMGPNPSSLRARARYIGGNPTLDQSHNSKHWIENSMENWTARKQKSSIIADDVMLAKPVSKYANIHKRSLKPLDNAPKPDKVLTPRQTKGLGIQFQTLEHREVSLDKTRNLAPL